MTGQAVVYWFTGACTGLCLALLGVSVLTLRAARRWHFKTLELSRQQPSTDEIKQLITDVEQFTRDLDQR